MHSMGLNMATDLSLGHHEVMNNEDIKSNTSDNKFTITSPLTYKDNYASNIILYDNHNEPDNTSIVRDELMSLNAMYSDLRALEVYHKALHEERRKVRAFKHELPFCMQLLDDAIEASREHLEDRLTCKLHTPSLDDAKTPKFVHNGGSMLPTSGEFYTKPNHLKRKWTSYVDVNSEYKQVARLTSSMSHPIAKWMPTTSPNDRIAYENPSSSNIQAQGNIIKGSIGKFEELCVTPEPLSAHPLIHQNYMKVVINGAPISNMEANNVSQSPVTCNMNGIAKLSNELHQVSSLNVSKPTVAMSSAPAMQRKPRRCWSPELHQLFLKSLNHLGGCQVATPKQIRELMNVEGLTNDEVKSHLQKFRLHMRRPNMNMGEMESSKQGGAGNGQHVVVFGCNPLMRGLSQTDSFDAYHDRNDEDPRQIHRNLPLICDNSEVTSMEDDETVENQQQEERRNIHSRHGVDHHRPPRLDINQENFDLRIACTTKYCQ